MSSKFPWGCHVLVAGDGTQWPASRQIIHKKSTCECRREGGDESLVRDYLFVIAYNYYYKRDRVLFDADACNEMVKKRARALGLELRGQTIWDSYPDCKPGPGGE